MKLLVIKLASAVAALVLSTSTFAASIQANELVKAESFNTSEFSVLMHSAITQSIDIIQINQDFAKNTADEILVNQTNKFNKVNTKSIEQVSVIAE